ncbi:MAG: DNA integrity scanning diadenylate cyclase DisA [Acidimicrobiia bacterium]
MTVRSESMLAALRLAAPGTALRDGLDRIMQAGMGALVVVGAGPDVLSVSSGGFLLDAEFTPQRLFELAKMDGAIIVAEDASRIARANVHLVPDSHIPTTETGTRHRTAERVARQIDVPVITVSEDMRAVAIHRRDQKYVLDAPQRVLARADQALTILERYKNRLDSVSQTLSGLEVEDLVTVRDVATVMQRAEMVMRLFDEIEGYVVELGDDGRLVVLQLEELTAGVAEERRFVVKDYVRNADDIDAALVALGRLDAESLLDLHRVAGVLGARTGVELELTVSTRGFRLLHQVPKVPEAVSDRVIERFGTLQKILRASRAELEEVEGVGDVRAQAIKEGLSRLAETSILDRYV